MAQVTLMAGIVSLHGKLGEYCYRTCKNGKVILSRMPAKSNKPISDAQKKHRERFRCIVRKVNEVMQDPTQREAMERMYKKQRRKKETLRGFVYRQINSTYSNESVQ